MLKERSKNEKLRKENRIKEIAKYETFKNKGLYEIHNNAIVLSDEESYNKYFNAKRLAKTVDISILDADLLSSIGKTYVFAKQTRTGKTIELYHSSIECNSLFITLSYPDNKRIAEFNSEEWQNAPYAQLVGQTNNKNHFVC